MDGTYKQPGNVKENGKNQKGGCLIFWTQNEERGEFGTHRTGETASNRPNKFV